MPVIYNEQPIRPYPLVTIEQASRNLPDGRKIGNTVTATLVGKLTAEKTNDTYTPLAIEHKLASIIAKQKNIRDIFSVDGKLFECQGYDGTAPVKFNARVQSISFQDGLWTDTCDYTVVLTGTSFAGEEFPADPLIESSNENWQFEEAEAPGTYRATHSLQAKGLLVYDADGTITIPAWQRAKTFVIDKLAVDWNNSTVNWSPLSGQARFSDSVIAPETNLAFNRIRQESTDEVEGTYSVTETFFIAPAGYWEEYTISTRRTVDDYKFGSVVNLQGTIHGLAVNNRDNVTKLANAQAAWAAISTLLYSRASAYVPGITLNTHPTVATSDINYNDGSFSYSWEFNDRILVNDTFEIYNVSMQTSLEDSKTTVNIDGTISGEIYINEPFDRSLKLARATAQWELVRLLLFSRAVAESGINDLAPFPITASFTPNKGDGSINYNFSFDNRIPTTVHHDFTVSSRYSRLEGRYTLSVEGTITGYRTNSPTNPFIANNNVERYNNALSFWNGMSNNVFGLATTYVDTTNMNPLPIAKQVNHNPFSGTITYNYEYDNSPLPCYPGALSQVITVSEDYAVPVIAVIGVVGRAAGPIIQDINTLSAKKRTVSIEIVMPVDWRMDTCTVSSPPSVDIGAYAPTGDIVRVETNQDSWSPATGRYNHNISWIYQ